MMSIRGTVRIGMICTLLLACKNNNTDNNKNNDWNSGRVTIQSDTNLISILDQMKPVYENSFPEATVNFKYKSEDELVRDFVAGKVTAIILSRMLSPAESQEASARQKMEIRENVFAYDAIAVIAGKNCKDSNLALEQIKDLLQKESPLKLIFDNPRSGIAKQVMKLCNIEPEAFKNAFVVKNPQEVIDYVTNNPNAIGFIPFNYISNSYEQTDLKNRQKIKLLSLSIKDTVYQLSQEDIAFSAYPLLRPLNIILGNNPDMVNRGFTSFLHRSQAGRILLKSGLVPRNMPIRKVVVRDALNAQ